MDYARFVKQAAGYNGVPARIAQFRDHYDETHVVIEMVNGDIVYYLDWIGGALAPDELDAVPSLNLHWRVIE